ncbi:condensin complex subunit 2 [Drosophila kikkawai]|uniref:Condensin complex subunit 2 n=1 Tax=Drosophila kikkawai TaxID=30033 RepID=A0A6P4HUJ0_DROKI|nr:condensin complex subunit 2 [Drosophila kikkawai]
MTLPRSETPLRRSAVGSYRESMAREVTMVNDDEAERQEARRRTLIQQQQKRQSTLESIEDNETIRSCLEIYNGNKLSKDNAWSLTLIDSLANLLDHHHKRMSNFKMAGSSLEASSKVYGLRVDSIYMDAMRISAGLSARTLTDKQLEDAEDEGPESGQADGGRDEEAGRVQKEAAPKPKKQKKNVSTVTKNKDTLNARLDSAPLQDPVFGKLNSTVGSINASNRLMHNILPSLDSELRLRTTYMFWDGDEEPTEEVKDHTTANASEEAQQWPSESLMSADWVQDLLPDVDELVLRPLHTGYIITSDPNPRAPTEKPTDPVADEEDNRDFDLDGADDLCPHPNELSMAFDINGECEPMPDLDGQPPLVLEVDCNELDELTTEEQVVINNCRRLRKQAEFIEDLRPVDGTSKLEYSYRPMAEQISQFWAGPSHWKFKRTRQRSTLFQTNAQTDPQSVPASQRPKKSAQLAAKRRAKEVAYGKFTENLFQTLDASIKLRKVNFQKKWDARKLVLPTKFNIDPDYFFKYDSAPSIKLSRHCGKPDSDEGEDLGMDMDDAGPHHGDGDDNDPDLLGNEHFTAAVPANVSVMPAMGDEACLGEGLMDVDPSQLNASMRDACNNTVFEIGTEFEGAPTQVTKVIVPFAKRAKVIDMKNLKKCCNSLIQKQLLNVVPEEMIPSHPVPKDESYSKGMASFNEVYSKLPNLLTTKMSDSLSTSVAFYAVLHLANDMKLRLIPQKNLEDFQIRQVLD